MTARVPRIAIFVFLSAYAVKNVFEVVCPHDHHRNVLEVERTRLEVARPTDNQTLHVKMEVPAIRYPIRYDLPPWLHPQKEEFENSVKLVSMKRNLLVILTPKVMCTSVRRALANIECGPNSKISCTEARRHANLGRVDVKNLTRVVLFRDPFERALSAYLNSKTNKYISLRGCPSSDVCSFSEWVDKISKRPIRAMENIHMRSQVGIAQLDKMHYNFFLRISSPIDQHFFWTELVKSPATHENKHAESARAELDKSLSHFSQDIFRKLATVYEQDLKMWSQLLQHGTPREPNEYTLYDFYIANSTSLGNNMTFDLEVATNTTPAANS